VLQSQVFWFWSAGGILTSNFINKKIACTLRQILLRLIYNELDGELKELL